MITLLSQDNLINNIYGCINPSGDNKSKPLAFLVGSPISFDYSENRGVPGIEQMLDFIRDEVKLRVARAINDFETEIEGKAGAELYQSAFGWLLNNAGIDAVNKVVRTAVLKARLNSDTFERDGEPKDWFLPRGVETLGQLISLVPDKIAGPILTTNFDPLLRLSIRKTNLHPAVHILTADGNIGGRLDDELNARNLIYLHGYWRASDTFHTFSQLLNPRPKLRESLKKVLTKCRLVVVAYSGWDDIFTQALSELIQDEDAEIDVLWCFYESDANIVADRYKNLISKVSAAIGRGRFLTFGGIDCHSIFFEIVAILENEKKVKTANKTPPHGWEFVNADYFSKNVKPLQEPDEVLRYFDGAVPSWRYALSDKIPRRNKVNDILAHLEKVRTLGDCTINVILAAGGEGKTTILLQTAADLALKSDWSVLWRLPESDKIEVSEIENLDVKKNWLLVSDDGDLIVQDIKDLMRRLRQKGHSNIHFLLAAREPEWKSAGGSSLDAHRIPLRTLDSSDAQEIVKAWARYGDKGLKSLASLPSDDARVRRFEDAVADESNYSNEGSFFGGLLDVRLGEKGLREHVKNFLKRLRKIEIEASRYSLFDALIYTASCHGIGIPGIFDSVLAGLLDVPSKDVFTRVVRPLGEEAAGVRSARHIFTRHRKVAEVILEEAETSFDVDLAEIYANLVKQYHQTGRNIKFKDLGDDSYGKILHIGTLLAKKLPPKIGRERRKEIAIAASKTAIECEPRRISMLVDLGRTYFEFEMFNEAISLFRSNLSDLKNKIDYDTDVRGYWLTWAACEGKNNALAINSWLAAISISDFLTTARLTEKDAIFGCTGLGTSFLKLTQHNFAREFAQGLRACAYIVKKYELDEKGLLEFSKFYNEAYKLGISKIENDSQAFDWLNAGIQAAYSFIKDDFIRQIVAPSSITFQKLLTSIQPIDSLRHMPDKMRVIKKPITKS